MGDPQHDLGRDVALDLALWHARRGPHGESGPALAPSPEREHWDGAFERGAAAIESFPLTSALEDWLTAQARMTQWWGELVEAGARLWFAPFAHLAASPSGDDAAAPAGGEAGRR